MKIVNVRDADQLEAGFAVRRTVFVEEQGVSIEEEMDEYDSSPETCQHVIALSEDGIVVGAARFRRYDGDTAKLQRIAVLQPYRGVGYGSLLVRHMEEEAAAAGYLHAILDAQVQAEGFYRALGYETISTETFLDAGIPHVRMRKLLNKAMNGFVRP